MIGLFDSGLGGLTVLARVRERLLVNIEAGRSLKQQREIASRGRARVVSFTDGHFTARDDFIDSPRAPAITARVPDGLGELRRQLSGFGDPLTLLAGVFAHAPVGFQIYRADGRSLLTNDAFRQMFGSEPPPEYNVLQDDIARARGVLHLIERAFAGETTHTPVVWYDPRDLTSVKIEHGRLFGGGIPLSISAANTLEISRADPKSSAGQILSVSRWLGIPSPLRPPPYRGGDHATAANGRPGSGALSIQAVD